MGLPVEALHEAGCRSFAPSIAAALCRSLQQMPFVLSVCLQVFYLVLRIRSHCAVYPMSCFFGRHLQSFRPALFNV